MTDDHAVLWLDARAHVDALDATLDRAGDDEAPEQRPYECPVCHASGAACNACGGEGIVWGPPLDMPTSDTRALRCLDCQAEWQYTVSWLVSESRWWVEWERFECRGGGDGCWSVEMRWTVEAFLDDQGNVLAEDLRDCGLVPIRPTPHPVPVGLADVEDLR